MTLSIMGAGTFLIGLLPGYAQIGWLAPILLVVLRLIQGFAVGEWGGSMIIVLEPAPQHRRGFFSAWPNTGGFSAQILITLVFLCVYSLSDADQLGWGWRVPFLLSAVVMLVGIWMRRALQESSVFTDAVAAREAGSGRRALTSEDVAHHATLVDRVDHAEAVETAKAGKSSDPLVSVFRDDWRSLLLILGLRFAEALPYFLLTVFVLSYGPNHLGIDKFELNLSILIMAVLAFLAHGLWAMLSDRIGRRPVYFISTLTTVPSGSRTKNRRTPHGSSVSGCTISAPAATAAAWAASTSSTSIDAAGTTGAVASCVIRLSCTAESPGCARVTIQPWSITASSPNTRV